MFSVWTTCAVAGMYNDPHMNRAIKLLTCFSTPCTGTQPDTAQANNCSLQDTQLLAHTDCEDDTGDCYDDILMMFYDCWFYFNKHR